MNEKPILIAAKALAALVEARLPARTRIKWEENHPEAKAHRLEQATAIIAALEQAGFRLTYVGREGEGSQEEDP
jgi:hypothetical protein